LDFRRADEYIQSCLRQCIVMHLFCHPGGCCLRRLCRCSCDHLGFRHDALNRHDFGDFASLDLCSCQQNIQYQYPGAMTTT
jgi:hypothetical protein